MSLKTYRSAATFSVIAVAVLALLLTGCPPPKAAQRAEGTYMVSGTQMYGDDSRFDVRDKAVYGKQRVEGIADPSINISDQQLTINRCTWCHECGFQDAFDWKHFGSDDWSPRYKGEEWRGPLQRMKDMENTMIQEERIVERIYKFLHDSTLGIYDESADDRGAVVVELDDQPVDQDGAAAAGEGADSGAAAAGDEQGSAAQDKGGSDNGGDSDGGSDGDGGGGGGANGAVA